MSDQEKLAGHTNQLMAVSIDVRAAIAFARAALKGVCSLSDDARVAVLAALDEEAGAVALDDLPGADAVGAMISDTRRALAGD